MYDSETEQLRDLWICGEGVNLHYQLESRLTYLTEIKPRIGNEFKGQCRRGRKLLLFLGFM